jgi:integrase
MRRPPKPKVSKPYLTWKWNPRRMLWEPYHRVTWSEDGKRKERALKLDWQGDQQELDRLYWECQAGRSERQIAPAKHTWQELIVAWRNDPRVQGKLADGTKQSYRRTMDAILQKNAAKDVRNTTRKALRTAHDSLSATPRKADKYLQTVSLLWNYAARKLDWPLGDNPASGIDHFGRQREFEPWPDWMVRALSSAPVNVRTAAEIILSTGQRPNAAITMRFEQIHGEWMTVRDEKAGAWLEVYCPTDLRDYVKQVPIKGAHLLAKNLSEPLGYDAIERAFRTWRDSLGDRAKPFSLHGLRKLAIIRLAEAGCSDAEIQAVTGQSAEMVAFYRSKASRKTLSRAAQKRRE